MITLDEAIELMEAQVGELDGVIGVILYADDILQYLKEYRERQENLDQFETYQFEQTRPLTWSELRQMEGNPVWLESHGDITKFTGWVIVSNFHHDMVHFIFSHYDGEFLTYEMTVPKEQMGTEWQAYRKERDV